jgi:hypothetical protein
VEQLRTGGKRCEPLVSLGVCVEVGPRGRHQRACAVSEHQHKMQLSAPTHVREDFQRLPFKWVAGPDDCYSLGSAINVVVMGSLSGGLSTRWTTGG